MGRIICFGLKLVLELTYNLSPPLFSFPHHTHPTQGGLALLTARNADRASKLHANDWYRLERALEVTLMTSPPSSSSSSSSSSFTGVRSQPLSSKYDFRCFFLIAPREELCHTIDQRCLQMIEKGLLEETASLLAAGVLDPASPPGRAIGYRQAIEYLSKERVEGEEGEAAALKVVREGRTSGRVGKLINCSCSFLSHTRAKIILSHSYFLPPSPFLPSLRNNKSSSKNTPRPPVATPSNKWCGIALNQNSFG